VRDRLFGGTDVEEALASAAAALGLPVAELRYVVLEAGTAGGRGLKPTPARIAVLIQEAAADPGGRSDGARREQPLAQPVRPAPEADTRASLRALVRAVAEAGALEIEAEIEETEEAVVLQLRGRDSSFFHGEDGRGDVLFAFEHLLQRIHGQALHPLALRVRCEGFRERRDQALAEEAQRLAEAVRADGEPRTMEPLNAYERRIVHLALQDAPGVTTFSVGEGRDRRVTVAPKSATPPSEGPDRLPGGKPPSEGPDRLPGGKPPSEGPDRLPGGKGDGDGR
jgi:spoIIIJ-associated protein